MKLAFLFPGQGSQHVGMGRALAERVPAAASLFRRVDDLLGRPISQLCWEGPDEELRRTVNAQPALLAADLAAFYALRDAGIRPSMAAGHSLGEWAALVAADVLTGDDAIALVALRAEAMERASQRSLGGMAAVIGLEDSQVEAICDELGLACANYNSPGQVVVSGDPAALARLPEAVKAAGGRRVLPLNVSGAFHSPAMEPAAAELAAALAGRPIAGGSMPVPSNALGGVPSDGESWGELLGRQVVSPVRWSACVRALAECGADAFVECGPGTVLAGLVKRILPGAPVWSVGVPDDVAALQTALAERR
jgi:[acyl-carrier-protein] S-malonyltransferase